MKNKFKIAIDGPVGVGKGTLAVALSKKLGALYINTGAMYRAVALACLEEGVDLANEKDVLRVVAKSKIELRVTDYGTRVFLNDEEAGDKIFSVEVSNAVPITSAYASVRKQMVQKQKEIAEGENVVIEGRDIATEVVPDADLKIFLTASLEIRAARRYKQILAKGDKTILEEVTRDIERRDKLDIERDASPLTVVEDAYVLDTTNLTIDETVGKVMEKLKEKGIV